MTTKPVTLGSDYNGSTVYLGLLRDVKVLSTVSVDFTFPKTGIETLRNVLRTFKEEFDIDKIWAEEAWVNGIRFPRSGMMLSRTQAFIEIAAYDNDIEPRFIHPMTWRKDIYGKPRPPNPKEVARKYVRELFGFETKFKNQHDICEAILLAYYGQRNGNIAFEKVSIEGLT